jgi:hypothetical protein
LEQSSTSPAHAGVAAVIASNSAVRTTHRRIWPPLLRRHCNQRPSVAVIGSQCETGRGSQCSHDSVGR